MKQALAISLALVALCPAALADRVTLKDGRAFDGAVTQEEGKVLVKLSYGTLSFPASDVVSIEKMLTNDDQLDAMLAKTKRDDPEALLKAAVWARENDLARRGDDLLKEILAIAPEHATAHKLLGQVKMDGKWLDLPAAIALAENKLEAGKTDLLLKEFLPAMSDASRDPAQKFKVRQLEASCLLRAGKYDLAQKAFDDVAAKATGLDAAKSAAIAEILRNHADGMYVLSEDYPPAASLTGQPSVDHGPGPLSEPKVLAGAVRDKAKAELKAGRTLMDDGKKVEATEPEAAKNKYALAARSFDTADALVPDIARSYRVEIARRRIGIITLSMNAETQKFDLLKADLGKKEISPAAYKDVIAKMLRALNNAKADLESIVQLAGPFDRELVLELTDAKLGLQKVNALRDILNQELNGK